MRVLHHFNSLGVAQHPPSVREQHIQTEWTGVHIYLRLVIIVLAPYISTLVLIFDHLEVHAASRHTRAAPRRAGPLQPDSITLVAATQSRAGRVSRCRVHYGRVTTEVGNDTVVPVRILKNIARRLSSLLMRRLHDERVPTEIAFDDYVHTCPNHRRRQHCIPNLSQHVGYSGTREGRVRDRARQRQAWIATEMVGV